MTTKPNAQTAQPGNGQQQQQVADPQLALPTIGEEHQEPGYLGTYKTREEAEAAFSDLSKKVGDFDKWREESAAREQRLQDQLDRLISGVAAPHSTTSAPAGDDFAARLAALPDPVEKPTEFKAGLAELVRGEVKTVTAASTEQSTKAQKMNKLWGDFQTKYADLAKFKRVVDSVTSDEVARLQEGRVDPYQSIMSDPDRFMDRIARLTRAELDSMGVKFGEQQEQQQQQVNGDGSRALSITGGGGQQVYPNPNGGGQPSSFINEIKELQKSRGLI